MCTALPSPTLKFAAIFKPPLQLHPASWGSEQPQQSWKPLTVLTGVPRRQSRVWTGPFNCFDLTTMEAPPDPPQLGMQPRGMAGA